jgi:hypothetical protein
MSPDEIKLGYLLLNFLCLSTRDRPVNTFNLIGRSGRGEFEMWLEKDVLPHWGVGRTETSKADKCDQD